MTQETGNTDSTPSEVAITPGSTKAANADETLPELTKKESKAAEERENRADLRKLEAVVTKGDKALPVMAEALMEIRDRRLYKVAKDPETGKGYKSFDKYLADKSEWGFTRQYASRLIANRKEQLAIEAGEEPTVKTPRGPVALEPHVAAAKISRAWDRFVDSAANSRDNATGDKFATDWDAAYNKMQSIMDALIKRYPAPEPEAPADAPAK